MNRWALVTGAARRIGRTIALRLAQEGWDIAIHYHHSAEDAASLATAIQDLGQKACLIEMDLSHLTLVEKLIPHLVSELGPLAALINNASLFEPDIADPHGKRHHVINVEAPQILSESFYKTISGHQELSPSIIHLLDADPTKPEFSAYNRSRVQLASLTLDMAKRFAPYTRVNGVALGPIIPSPRESVAHFQALLESTPLKASIQTETAAAAVHFLATTPSITGEILHIDNGRHLFVNPVHGKTS